MCAFPSPAIDHFLDWKESSFGAEGAGMPRTSRPPLRSANGSSEADPRSKLSGFGTARPPLSSSIGDIFRSKEFLPVGGEGDGVNGLSNGHTVGAGINTTKIFPAGAPFHSARSPVNGSICVSSLSSSPGRGEGFGRSPPFSAAFVQNMNDEFFDAAEDDLSEYVSDDESARSHLFGRSPSSRNDFREVSSRFHEEKMRRVAAEEALNIERQKRKELLGLLTSLGASLPAGFVTTEKDSREDETNSVADKEVETSVVGSNMQVEGSNMSDEAVEEGNADARIEEEEAQEIVVARMVSAAIARGVAAAAAKEELERVLAQKEREMSRLRDKMQFWERMNIELSNQTQENVEMQRMRRRRRQRMQKVVLASLGVVIGVACSAAIAYAFSSFEGSSSREGTAAATAEAKGLEGADSPDTIGEERHE